jgi:hypothetical protein
MHRTLFDPDEIPADIREYFEETSAACGAPWARVVERSFDHEAAAQIRLRRSVAYDASRHDPEFHQLSGIEKGRLASSVDRGFAPSCACAADVVPCRVLDCFAGAGTTLLVADRLQRDAIGIELNADYTRMAMDRCRDDAPLFAEPSPPPAEPPEEPRIRDLFA